MISEKMVKVFYKEDPSLIENYDKAIADKAQIWDCHHKLEIDENKTRAQLKAEGRYFNRPADELIFLTRAEHMSIHKPMSETRLKMSANHADFTGENNPMYGKNAEDYMTPEAILLRRKRMSESHKGKSPTNKGKHRVYDENGKCHYE